MTKFTEPLTLTLLGTKTDLWKLRYPFEFRDITVPVGFITDGASIPRIFRPFLPVWGRWGRAAVIHDYLIYRHRIGDPHPSAPTRRDVDRIFYEAMKVSNVGVIPRWLMWGGARIGSLFGASHSFNDHHTF